MFPPRSEVALNTQPQTLIRIHGDGNPGDPENHQGGSPGRAGQGSAVAFAGYPDLIRGAVTSFLEPYVN